MRSFGVFALVGAALVACGDDSTGGGGAGGSGALGGGGQSSSQGGGGASQAGGAGGVGGSESTGGGGALPTGTPRFVAVGYGGRRMTSDDGSTWENNVVVDPNGGDDNNLFRGVGFGGGLYVAVGGSSAGQIFTSPDGIAWTSQTPAGSWLGDVVYVDGAFVAAGGNGLRQRSSDSGVTWTHQTDYYAGHYRGLAAGNGIVVSAGHTYGLATNTGLLSYSTDAGLTWSAEITTGPELNSIDFGNGVFVAVGGAGCLRSTDGMVFTDCGLAGGNLDSVTFLNGEFVVPDQSGYWHSANGADWQHLAAEVHGVTAYGLGLYLAVDWPDRVYSSPDLSAWSLVEQGNGPAFTEVVLGYVE
ncbi:MAG: sialidase family protein [Polyangiaceae bacterium]